jgi:hypothetical protein
MRLTPRVLRPPGVCGECRLRRHGYQLRCLEPTDHEGPHRWTPELLDGSDRRAGTRPPLRRATTSMAERLGRIVDWTNSDT